MRYREICQQNTGHPLTERIERQAYRDYSGQEIELVLIWSPTAREVKSAIDRAKNRSLRVLVVEGQIVCWDAYYVEHRDVANLLGHPELASGRDGKLFLLWDDDQNAYRFGGGSWWGRDRSCRDSYVSIPDIARLLKAGIEQPTRPSPVWEQRIVETIVVKDQFEVAGQLCNFAIHMNPTATETSILLSRSENKSLRGLVREQDGFVAVWDAYLMDHADAAEALRENGLGDWWPRFSIDNLADFKTGIVDIYIERDEDDDGGRGMSVGDWKKLTIDHFTRMMGKTPRFRES